MPSNAYENACRLCRTGSYVYNGPVLEVKKEIPDELVYSLICGTSRGEFGHGNVCMFSVKVHQRYAESDSFGRVL